jgi:hypothetical protein
MSRQSSAIALALAGAASAAVFACSSATSPNLTTPYVGTYTMDSVTAAALATDFPPNGTLDAAVGVNGTLKLTSDSFYIYLTGTFARSDSGTFSINGSSQMTLDGSLFSGTGPAALVNNQLQMTLTGGVALGNLYGLFTKQ